MPANVFPLLRRAIAAVLILPPLLAVATVVGAGQPPAAAAASSGPGAYWMVASDGGIFAFGGVPFEGSAGGSHLPAPIAGMASTPSGKGYWLAGSTGAVYNFGDAAAHGSPAALPAAARPTSPVVGIASSATGNGYWLATANGNLYAFGDAPFFGSLGGVALAKPIVGIAATPDGRGYWLVASDGGIFSFGDARFHGSTGAIHLNQPIVGMTGTATGGGYWLVASDGGIFSFGDARFHGSTGAIHLNQPIVGMTGTATGGGYWLVASDGGIFSFGDASFRGSTGGRTLARPIVGMALGHTLDPYAPSAQGYDISWPQCGGSYPAGPAFGVVGVNDGRPFTHNPCLASEVTWAGPNLSIYMNLSSPPTGSTEALNGPAGTCTGNNTGCMAYNYGYNAAVDAFSAASGAGAATAAWWLDVETGNTWDTNTTNNSLTIQGALDALGASGVVPGIYSTHYQFTVIAGDYAPKTPIWVATGSDFQTAQAYCDPTNGFGGGTIWLTQFGGGTYDQDYACPTPS